MVWKSKAMQESHHHLGYDNYVLSSAKFQAVAKQQRGWERYTRVMSLLPRKSKRFITTRAHSGFCSIKLGVSLLRWNAGPLLVSVPVKTDTHLYSEASKVSCLDQAIQGRKQYGFKHDLNPQPSGYESSTRTITLLVPGFDLSIPLIICFVYFNKIMTPIQCHFYSNISYENS
jgi:hypothetical protein